MNTQTGRPRTAKPRLIVISGPSGCGKTSVVHGLLKLHPGLLFSVSATSRPKRPDEIHGKDYFFIDRPEFEEKIGRGELAEWEQIYGDYYGSLKSEITRAFDAGKSILFDIDVKGALTLRKLYPGEALLIFIRPPGLRQLEERLKKRKTETSEALARRMQRVSMELGLAADFHYRIDNDVLELAIAAADEIIKRESSF